MTTWREFHGRQKAAIVEGRLVRYLDTGAGEPVVLLHGIPTWSYVWLPVLAPLTAIARVLAPDLVGYGFSDKADNFDRSIDRQAALLDRWMDQIGLTSAVIVGHDIGGGVAQRLATLYPSRIRKLCLINSVCYDSWPVAAMLQLGHPALDRMLSPAMLTRMLRLALRAGCDSHPPAALIDGLVAPYASAGGKRSLIRNASALNTNHTMEIVPLLRSIGVPTLIMWGEDDVFQPISYGERLAGDIPGANFVRLGGARHFAMIDRPEAVSARLRGFVKD